MCLAGGGCGCKEVYRFPHITYPYSLYLLCFCSSSIPSFCSFFMFFVLVANDPTDTTESLTEYLCNSIFLRFYAVFLITMFFIEIKLLVQIIRN